MDSVIITDMHFVALFIWAQQSASRMRVCGAGVVCGWCLVWECMSAVWAQHTIGRCFCAAFDIKIVHETFNF
jgi:hypothetical protein